MSLKIHFFACSKYLSTNVAAIILMINRYLRNIAECAIIYVTNMFNLVMPSEVD